MLMCAGDASQGPAPPRAQARRCTGDGGAALVEFALVAPLLILFLFGIIEFGSVFSQVLDVRHGAREGSRLVAVNYNPSAQTGQAQANTIGQAVCDKMDLGPTGVFVAITTAESLIAIVGILVFRRGRWKLQAV